MARRLLAHAWNVCSQLLDALRTPPASSSPSPLVESMEASPLPHKAPFTTIIRIQSPTPDPTPLENTMEVSESVIVDSPVETLMQPPPVPERRRAGIPRPILSRAKGYSTTSVGSRSATFPPKPFTFGSAMPSLSLDDCFTESPPRASPNPLAPPVAIRPKSCFQKTTAFMPPPPMGRRPCAPYERPRKQFRRSLSMFEHPEDVMQQQSQPEPMQAIMDLDEAPQLQLPHFFTEQEAIPRISKETMVDVLDGKFAQRFANTMVVDCRFEYEYRGGHINGAVNFNDKEELGRHLFQTPIDNTLLIFHCEYSAHRAPIAARFIRSKDRNINAHQYPRLTFPEVYILDGGYSSFFKDFKVRCFPQNYVEMNDKEHASDCERGLGRIKQQRGKLCRAQTFAFGQQHNESPTAAVRQTSTMLMSVLDIAIDESLDAAKRIESKRSVSY